MSSKRFGRPLAGDREAILADYCDGVPTKTMVDRHGVSAETIRNYARIAGLGPRRGRSGRCSSCFSDAVLYVGQCRDCRAEIALTDGRWVPRPGSGGVQEWVGS